MISYLATVVVVKVVELLKKNGLCGLPIFGLSDNFCEKPFEFDVVVAFNLVGGGLDGGVLSPGQHQFVKYNIK